MTKQTRFDLPECVDRRTRKRPGKAIDPPAPLYPGCPQGRPRLQKEFDAWIEKNPRFWELFVQYTRELIAIGFKANSADAVCHRVRWQTGLETTGARAIDGRPLKVCNDYTAYLARKFHKDFPDHAGFFRLRAVKMTYSKARRITPAQSPWFESRPPLAQ